MKINIFNWRIVTIVFVGLLCLLLFPTILPPVHHPPWAVSRGIMNGVSEASEFYHDEHKTWPQSLADLTNLIYCERGLVDGWGHPLIYQPFDPAKGYGAVISYGRDGKPGGTGEDADLEVRFGGR